MVTPGSHGMYCGCTLLATACGVPAETVSYYSCRNGIQRRWRVTCRHGSDSGEREPQKPLPGFGELDAVAAILVAGY
jgi:hypothetical protein